MIPDNNYQFTGTTLIQFKLRLRELAKQVYVIAVEELDGYTLDFEVSSHFNTLAEASKAYVEIKTRLINTGQYTLYYISDGYFQYPVFRRKELFVL